MQNDADMATAQLDFAAQWATLQSACFTAAATAATASTPNSTTGNAPTSKLSTMAKQVIAGLTTAAAVGAIVVGVVLNQNNEVDSYIANTPPAVVSPITDKPSQPPDETSEPEDIAPPSEQVPEIVDNSISIDTTSPPLGSPETTKPADQETPVEEAQPADQETPVEKTQPATQEKPTETQEQSEDNESDNTGNDDYLGSSVRPADLRAFISSVVKAEVEPGERLQYTLTVDNCGGSESKNVLVSITLDSCLKLESASIDDETEAYTYETDENNRLTLPIGTIDAGDRKTIVINAVVDDEATDGDIISNIFTVNGMDVTSKNNSIVVRNTCGISSDTESVYAGDSYSYALTFTASSYISGNWKPEAAGIQLPQGVKLAGYFGEDGITVTQNQENSSVLYVDVGEILPGQTKTVYLTVQVEEDVEAETILLCAMSVGGKSIADNSAPTVIAKQEEVRTGGLSFGVRETDTNKEVVSFVITFNCEGEYTYTVKSGDSDTVTGTICSGGELTLLPGQLATIEGLPAGTEYTVKATLGSTTGTVPGTVVADETASHIFTIVYRPS